MSNNLLDDAWKHVVGGTSESLSWLKQVVFGEFEDNRSMSAVVADMLLSFLPFVVIVTSARDLTAVIMRMVKHPEKRDDAHEWMLVIACMLPIILPIIGTVTGSVVGGIAGSEAGAVLRAVCLLLIQKGANSLSEILGFLNKFGHGRLINVLRDIKFTNYSKAMSRYITKFIGHIRSVIQQLHHRLSQINAFDALSKTLEKLTRLERDFYHVQIKATSMIPNAMAELDTRLQHVLLDRNKLKSTPAIAHTGTCQSAPLCQSVKSTPVRVHSMANNPLGAPTGTVSATSARTPTKVPDKTNLHVEKLQQPKQLRKPRQPTKTNKDIDHKKTTKNKDGSTTYVDQKGNAVIYNKDGYPDFSPYSKKTLTVKDLKGTIPPDDTMSNKLAGLNSTPKGYSWHHVEDGKTMQLVSTELHKTFPHTGGASTLRNR